jgi:hypothetical protein
MENNIGTQFAIPSLGGCTYFEFSEVCAIPLEHTKTSFLKPMFICNTLIQVVTNILTVPLIIYSNEQDQAPCNTFILFLLHYFRLLGVY